MALQNLGGSKGLRHWVKKKMTRFAEHLSAVEKNRGALLAALVLDRLDAVALATAHCPSLTGHHGALGSDQVAY